MKRLLVGMLLVAMCGLPAPAQALTRTIEIRDGSFTPTPVTVVQGTTVEWVNTDSEHQHNSTSNQGFWKSPNLSLDQRFSAVFANAGRFAYHCTIHTSLKGTVVVPVKASGTSRSGWKLRWSSLSVVPASRSFDVQVKAPGTTTWRWFKIDTRAATAFFNPRAVGSWKVRARTDNRNTGMSSGWSPARSVRIS